MKKKIERWKKKNRERLDELKVETWWRHPSIIGDVIPSIIGVYEKVQKKMYNIDDILYSSKIK